MRNAYFHTMTTEQRTVRRCYEDELASPSNTVTRVGVGTGTTWQHPVPITIWPNLRTTKKN